MWQPCNNFDQHTLSGDIVDFQVVATLLQPVYKVVTRWQQPGSLINRSEIHCMYKCIVQFQAAIISDTPYMQINTMALSKVSFYLKSLASIVHALVIPTYMYMYM